MALRSEWEVNEREIDLSIGGASHEFRRADVVDPQRSRGVPAVKASEQRREVDPPKRLNGTDRQMPAQQPTDSGNGVPAVLGRGNGPHGGRKQRPAGLGQLVLASAADEQVTTEFAL